MLTLDEMRSSLAEAKAYIMALEHENSELMQKLQHSVPRLDFDQALLHVRDKIKAFLKGSNPKALELAQKFIEQEIKSTKEPYARP